MRRRYKYMRSLFGALCHNDDDVEARCLVAMTLFAGSPLIAADHGTRSRTEVLELVVRRLLV